MDNSGLEFWGVNPDLNWSRLDCRFCLEMPELCLDGTFQAFEGTNPQIPASFSVWKAQKMSKTVPALEIPEGDFPILENPGWVSCCGKSGMGFPAVENPGWDFPFWKILDGFPAVENTE